MALTTLSSRIMRRNIRGCSHSWPPEPCTRKNRTQCSQASPSRTSSPRESNSGMIKCSRNLLWYSNIQRISSPPNTILFRLSVGIKKGRRMSSRMTLRDNWRIGKIRKTCPQMCTLRIRSSKGSQGSSILISSLSRDWQIAQRPILITNKADREVDRATTRSSRYRLAAARILKVDQSTYDEFWKSLEC